MAVRSEQVSRNDGAVGGNHGLRLFPFTLKNEMKKNKKSGEKLSKKGKEKKTAVASACFSSDTSMTADIRSTNA